MASVLSYSAKWNLNNHTGQIVLKVSAATLSNPYATVVATLQVQTPEELNMLVDLLRNEKPIEYDSTSKELRLGEWEVTGEGES